MFEARSAVGLNDTSKRRPAMTQTHTSKTAKSTYVPTRCPFCGKYMKGGQYAIRCNQCGENLEQGQWERSLTYTQQYLLSLLREGFVIRAKADNETFQNATYAVCWNVWDKGERCVEIDHATLSPLFKAHKIMSSRSWYGGQGVYVRVIVGC
jgi:ribosomal protein S27E